MHRDAPDNADDFEDDDIFGGWMNTSPHTQYFSCVLKSHVRTDPTQVAIGFAKIPKDKHAALKAASTLVAVPPGHILLFNENIIHQVLGRKFKHAIMRIHMGFAVTDRIRPMVTDIKELLETGAVVPLKSGQVPPTYPKLWWTNWFGKLIEFSAGIQNEQCKETVTRHSTVKGCKRVRSEHDGIVKRFLPSLAELNIPFTAYTAKELALYTSPY